MPHWREEYLAALAVRDQREKANVELYDAFTRLADRSTQLPTLIDSDITPVAGRRSSVVGESQQPVSSALGTVPRSQHSSEPGPSPAELLKTTRADLSEAQRSRTDLQDQLNRLNVELDKLRKRSQRDGRRLDTLESERAILGKRLKDRDEELREKTKLLEDFQAELASLNLEFNMAEKRSKELQRENKELVDRWMARMGQEADAMNDAFKFS